MVVNPFNIAWDKGSKVSHCTNMPNKMRVIERRIPKNYDKKLKQTELNLQTEKQLLDYLSRVFVN